MVIDCWKARPVRRYASPSGRIADGIYQGKGSGLFLLFLQHRRCVCHVVPFFSLECFRFAVKLSHSTIFFPAFRLHILGSPGSSVNISPLPSPLLPVMIVLLLAGRTLQDGWAG